MSMDRESGIIPESVIFREGLTELSFTEPHHRNNGIVNVQTLVADPARKTPDEWTRFMIALVDLIEALQLALRNPPDEIGG